MQSTFHPIRRTYTRTYAQLDAALGDYHGIRAKLAEIAHPNAHRLGLPAYATSYLFSKEQPQCRVDVQLMRQPSRVVFIFEYFTPPGTLKPLEDLAMEFGLQQTGINHIKSTASGRTGV